MVSQAKNKYRASRGQQILIFFDFLVIYNQYSDDNSSFSASSEALRTLK